MMYKTAKQLSMLGFGLGVSAIVGWLLLREKRAERAANAIVESGRRDERHHADSALVGIALPLDTLVTENGDEEHADANDLTRIKGIGPRFADALQKAGISTFAKLAEETPESLAALLAPYVTVSVQRIRRGDWIGQARALAQN